MRFVLVALLVGLCAYTVSSIAIDTTNYAQKQKDILLLFKYINQPSYYKEHVQIADTYKFNENAGLYTKPEVVEYFQTMHMYGVLLQKGEIFSIFNEKHMTQAIALFKLLYYAKDYDTFYKTAVWARNHLNEGMFLYSFSVALIHRPDTYYFVLPPIYEIYPWYFYSTEVIQEAQKFKQLYSGQQGGKYNDVTIYSNYSGYYLNLHPEQYLSYFMEDVGINSFYYYYNLYYPFWMSGEEFNLKYDHRGELFYYMYQQILARFYLERLSNDFGEIEWFNWDLPLKTGYYPSLAYPNGLEFPTRPNFANLYEYFYTYGQKWSFKSMYGYSHTLITDYERRIMDAIDSGYVYTGGQKLSIFSQGGLEILANYVEGNPDSPYFKYFGGYLTFARHLMGYSYQPLDYHKLYPSVLEHFETSMRDPAFYMMYKKMMIYLMKYKYQHYKSYTMSDLVFNGVTVKKVEFDRLITYFDYVYADLSNAVYVTPEEYVQDTFKIKVAQESLNHKPFTYKIYVDSNQDVDAVVKVFLGPKYDEYDRYINLTENWMNWVQLDHFTYKLKSGQNVITKNSQEIYSYMHDRTTYYELYQKALGVNDKGNKFHLYGNQIQYGFPQRFMLPKGTHGGMAYQIYVMVSPMVPYKTHSGEPMVGSGMQYVDGYSMGYPFDRPIEFEQMFYQIPNSYFYEVKIYHRRAEDVTISTV